MRVVEPLTLEHLQGEIRELAANILRAQRPTEPSSAANRIEADDRDSLFENADEKRLPAADFSSLDRKRQAREDENI